ATIILGYVIARVTLKPTRMALAYQKQFIGNVAHELRTPLSVIKTNTEVALLNSSINRELKDTLLINIDELDRISQIINNLLSLSTLVRSEGMEFTSVDFSELLSQVIDKYSALAKGSGIGIAVRKSPSLHVYGNVTALEQIAGNVIKNAINYTPRGGRVQITLVPAFNNYVELIVQDSGIGIARNDLFHIFEPFYRADPARSRLHYSGRKTGGTGLGLTIVSELVKAHGGRIMMRSTVGEGTTVTITLPGPRTDASTEAKETHDASNEITMDFLR
ncbi:MAG TPA: HAMP domain-containing sensor histidine kinase, partial [Candidatus Paceibacterota bacterium]|nr:HAMP domain-containing sensor histidine kinase [Candidatus Paceibacterota bacterium]